METVTPTNQNKAIQLTKQHVSIIVLPLLSPLNHSPTHSLTHPPTHSLTHPLTYSEPAIIVSNSSFIHRSTNSFCLSSAVVCLLHPVKECDRLSLVSYDTQVYLDFSLTAMDKANKDRTKLSVEKLQDGSSTNLCGGLMKGGTGGGRG